MSMFIFLLFLTLKRKGDEQYQQTYKNRPTLESQGANANRSRGTD